MSGFLTCITALLRQMAIAVLCMVVVGGVAHGADVQLSGSEVGATKSHAEVRYPPYPDVWGGLIPFKKQYKGGVFPYQRADGEIVFHLLVNNAHGKKEYLKWSFFSQSMEYVRDRNDIYIMNNSRDRMHSYLQIHKDSGVGIGSTRLEFYGTCMADEVSYVFNENGRKVYIFRVHKNYVHPQMLVDDSARESDASCYHKNIVSYVDISSYRSIIDLKDNTFIVFDEGVEGVAIRLSRDLYINGRCYPGLSLVDDGIDPVIDKYKESTEIYDKIYEYIINNDPCNKK